MVSTLPVAFDHHANASGRTAFAAWAEAAGYRGVSCEPVFRYGRSFDDAIEQLCALLAVQDCVFLSNIVGHSSALTNTRPRGTDCTLAFDYSDLESLIQKPNVVGHLVDDSLVADALRPLTGWVVICGEGSFDDSPADAGLAIEEVVHASSAQRDGDREGVCVCRLTDAGRYAEHRACIDYRAYFIDPATKLDLTVVADRYRRDRLGDYFMRSKVTFGTLGDCHMDDDIAVSYRSRVFHFPEM